MTSASKNLFDIYHGYLENGTLVVSIYEGCNPNVINETVYDSVEYIDPNIKIDRINFGCDYKVPTDVINYAIQKICTEIHASEIYVYAPGQIESNIIYPAGIKIHR